MVFGRNGFITKQDIAFDKLFADNNEGNLDGEKPLYDIDVEAFGQIVNYKRIYQPTAADEAE